MSKLDGHKIFNFAAVCPMAKGPEAIFLTQLIKDYDQNFF